MVRAYWKKFLETAGRNDALLKGSVCLGDTADVVNEACCSILDGRRTAFSYPENGYRIAMKGQPSEGDMNIVVDWSGKPVCIIETTAVRRFCFNEAVEADCKLEMLDKAAWLEEKEAEFKKELEELGQEFSSGITVCMEEFRVIWSQEA